MQRRARRIGERVAPGRVVSWMLLLLLRMLLLLLGVRQRHRRHGRQVVVAVVGTAGGHAARRVDGHMGREHGGGVGEGPGGGGIGVLWLRVRVVMGPRWGARGGVWMRLDLQGLLREGMAVLQRRRWGYDGKALVEHAGADGQESIR